jgi:hypothetical protein
VARPAMPAPMIPTRLTSFISIAQNTRSESIACADG